MMPEPIAPADALRRLFLGQACGHVALAALVAGGLLRPGPALASPRNTPAFESRVLSEALTLIGASEAPQSPEVQLLLPEIAENGAVVAVEIISNLPDTRRISLVVDKNPMPLTCQFEFGPGVRPRLATRIRMAETSLVRAVVEAGGKTFTALREVKVTLGGCGS